MEVRSSVGTEKKETECSAEVTGPTQGTGGLGTPTGSSDSENGALSTWLSCPFLQRRPSLLPVGEIAYPDLLIGRKTRYKMMKGTPMVSFLLVYPTPENSYPGFTLSQIRELANVMSYLLTFHIL